MPMRGDVGSGLLPTKPMSSLPSSTKNVATKFSVKQGLHGSLPVKHEFGQIEGKLIDRFSMQYIPQSISMSKSSAVSSSAIKELKDLTVTGVDDVKLLEAIEKTS